MGFPSAGHELADGALVLGLAYLFTFAAAALNVPLATQGLLQAGFTASLIGFAMSFRSALQMVATPLWAALADARGSAKMSAVRGQLSLAIAMAILAYADTPALLVLGYFVFGFFAGGSTTLIDSLNIISIGHDRHRFGTIRLWGTVGYAVVIIITGRLPPQTQRVVFGAAAVFALLSALALLNVRATRGEPSRLRWPSTLLKNRAFTAVVQVATLQWAAHASFTAFMIPLGLARGISQSTVALTIVAGLLVEVIALRASGRLYARFGPRTLLLLTTVTGVVRWLGLWLLHDTASFIVLHTLHGVTFGMFYATIVTAVASVSQPHERVSAQALLTAVGFGLGGALGSALAGVAFDRLGADATWAAMLFPAGAATLLVAFSSGIKSLCVPKSA